MSQHEKEFLGRNFATMLRTYRGDRSQAEFAKHLGISHQQTYQRYEKGQIPSGDVLHEIATRIGVSIDSLLSGKIAEPVSSRSQDGKTSHEPDDIPWGRELEENIQMTAAITLLCQIMTSRQLLHAAQDVVNNRALTQKSKLFWIKILGEWALKKAEAEEFARLSPEEKLAKHAADNELRKAKSAEVERISREGNAIA